jgi:hypothetical protein
MNLFAQYFANCLARVHKMIKHNYFKTTQFGVLVFKQSIQQNTQQVATYLAK